jgi:ElaB/YqjD/DUF883 family membrane-anchored ribosome-binding protein
MFASKNPVAQPGMVDQATTSADEAIRSTQRATNKALDGLSNAVQDLHQQAVPMVERAADRASEMAHQGMQAVRDRTQHLTESAHRMAEDTRHYVQDRPMKSLMFAALCGAAVAGLLSFLLGSQRQR